MSQPVGRATARAGSNIAFIKYWGTADAAINLPLNNSISMTLADAHTTTTVAWERDTTGADQIELDGIRLAPSAAQRIVLHLDRLRSVAGVTASARVVSVNNFPAAAGIASSASGFAALTVAGCAALGLALDARQLSALARLGSGSASRSLFGGFVEWEQGYDHASSIAHPLYPSSHWQLMDLVAVVSRDSKAVSSADGHRLAHTSLCQPGRLASLPAALAAVRQAIAERDLARLGPILEQDALAMHSVMMTSRPSLLYWQPATVELLHAVRRWREEEELAVYFTIDAGPNVHLLCAEADVAAVQARLAKLPTVIQLIVSGPGPAPQLLDQHLC